jgi:hypothetical protein
VSQPRIMGWVLVEWETAALQTVPQRSRVAELDAKGRWEEMTIESVLRNHDGVRLTFGRRWLIWDDMDGWTVYQKEYGAHKTTCIYRGQIQDEAVAVLIK